MARCKLIGVSRQNVSVFLVNAEGKFEQRRFSKGTELEINESQLTFHARRLINRKALKLVELDEEEVTIVPVVVETPVEVEEDFSLEPVTTTETDMDLEEDAPKKKRGRRKKSEFEIIDLIEDDESVL
jgi:hypothetical protein